jgi:hypothetical protein
VKAEERFVYYAANVLAEGLREVAKLKIKIFT